MYPFFSTKDYLLHNVDKMFYDGLTRTKFRVVILPGGKSYEMLRIVMNLPEADVMI